MRRLPEVLEQLYSSGLGALFTRDVSPASGAHAWSWFLFHTTSPAAALEQTHLGPRALAELLLKHAPSLNNHCQLWGLAVPLGGG